MDDIVDGLVKCGLGLIEGKIKGEEFELGSGVNHSINEDLICLVKIIQKNISQRERVSTIRHYVPIQAHELLGWKPNEKLDEYIHDFVNNQK